MSSELLLGKTVLYKDQYDASLLFPVPRAQNRASLPCDVIFTGVDVWNAYEISWLNAQGKPVVALAQFTVPCDSPNLIESKSFKLYLNSFNGTRFSAKEDVARIMKKDLSAAAGKAIEVVLNDAGESVMRAQWPGDGECLDALDISCDRYEVDSAYLGIENDAAVLRETLYSQLLKSNCPVTGQPDWATVVVRYKGRKIDREGLLKYIVSFRNHAEFHEHCVERMFCDIMQTCKPEKLSVFAKYTRRGGLDINPFRSNYENWVDNRRAARQ